MRPRTLRETVALARANPWGEEVIQGRIDESLYLPGSSNGNAKCATMQPSKKTNLRRNWLINICPQDVLLHIMLQLTDLRDLSTILAVCKSFNAVVADALILRARVAGYNPDPSLSPADLLREEGVRALASTHRTVSDGGLPLLLSVYSNTGYHGVTHCEWAKPFSYKAKSDDGVALGQFPSAVRAAEAVARHDAERLSVANW